MRFSANVKVCCLALKLYNKICDMFLPQVFGLWIWLFLLPVLFAAYKMSSLIPAAAPAITYGS